MEAEEEIRSLSRVKPIMKFLLASVLSFGRMYILISLSEIVYKYQSIKLTNSYGIQQDKRVPSSARKSRLSSPAYVLASQLFIKPIRMKQQHIFTQCDQIVHNTVLYDPGEERSRTPEVSEILHKVTRPQVKMMYMKRSLGNGHSESLVLKRQLQGTAGSERMFNAQHRPSREPRALSGEGASGVGGESWGLKKDSLLTVRLDTWGHQPSVLRRLKEDSRYIFFMEPDANSSGRTPPFRASFPRWRLVATSKGGQPGAVQAVR
ncbi:hypothetical protein STEG23_013752 [Scotinomys teguina]